MLKRREGTPHSAAETTLLGDERSQLERLESRLREHFSADLLGGTLFFAGLDEEPAGGDVRAALKGALLGKVGQIFPRLGEFAAPVRPADALSLLRADTLDGLPSYLREDGIGILRVTPEGVAVAGDREPLATVRRLVEDRSSYGQEATGRYLEQSLARPPCGATVEVVRVLLAALVRAGMVEVVHQGARIANPRDPRLEKVFGTLPGFRAATFALQREVDPDLRARVARRLQEFTGEAPAIAADLLAANLRRAFAADRQVVSNVISGLRALGLGIPDLLSRFLELIEGMERAPDDEVIKTADETWSDLTEARAAAGKLQEVLLDEEALSLLREALSLLREAREVLGRGFGGPDPNVEARDEARVEHLRELLADPLRIPDHLGTIQALVQEHREARARAAEKPPRPIAGLAQPDEGDPQAGPSIEALEAREHSLANLGERVAASLEEYAGTTDVVRVRVRDLYEEAVSSQEELEALLERIRRAAGEALAQGKRFLLF